jgi:OOP family OmpA-OmpF porin
MREKIKKSTWITGVLVTLISTYAMAQQPTGPYLGLYGGRAEVEFDDYPISMSSSGFGAFVGWQILEPLGIELGYFDANTMSTTLGEFRGELDAKALTASVIGTLPLGDRWSLFGRAGTIQWQSDQSIIQSDVLIYKERFKDTDIWLGVGIGVMLDNARIRLEYSRADAADSDQSLLSLGIVWFLGGR